MLDKNYYSIENQLKRAEEQKKISIGMKKFKRQLKDTNFKINSYWHLDKADINFKYLKGNCHYKLKNNKNYFLYWISRIDLFEILEPSFRRVFKKENIWKAHDNMKITKVLINWESKIKLIPPVLIPNSMNSCFLIQDGKHRFAVANYFCEEFIPIIILKEDEDMFLKITFGMNIKKLV